MNISLNSKFVAAVAQFKAGHDIRYYLNGVYVEPGPDGGAMIVATNGHALCLWLDPDGVVDRPVILRTGGPLLTACARKDAKYLKLTSDRLTVTDKNDQELFVQPNKEKWEIEGKFPDWKRVIPETSDVASLFDALNPSYVSLVTRTLKIGTTSDKWENGICFNQSAKNHGIVVTSTSMKAENFLAVIMPLRECEARKPKWVKGLKPAAMPAPGQQPSDAAPAEGGAE